MGLSIFVIKGIGLGTFFLGNQAWFAHWDWMLAAIIICFWLGFDLRGGVEASHSEATGLLEKLGTHSIGKLYSFHIKTKGILNHDTVLCANCRTCMGVCPKACAILLQQREELLWRELRLALHVESVFSNALNRF